MRNRFEEAHQICLQKIYLHLMQYNGEPYEFTGACVEGNYYKECGKRYLSERFNWISSFITGLAPLVYQSDKDEKYIKWSNSFMKDYYNKVFETPLETMHDLGFLYSPYSVALFQLTGDKMHRDIALKAADELAKRFDIKGQYIDAWGKMDDEQREGRAIIDCMMNIPLLFWAWKETGHTFYRDVAVAHAETTKKYFIRADYSVAHSFNFDRNNGKMTKENNDCGYSNGSHWARGTAWAIYGFAIAARYTKKEEYLNLAIKIAEKYIACLPEGKYIPVWDFRLPTDKPAKFCGKGNAATTWDENDSKNCVYNVDSSAAAIVSCGLMEINELRENKQFMKFVDDTLAALCSDEYFDDDLSHEGILKKQNGQMVYTMYGDYFFIEALQRRLHNIKTCW